jgi:SWIM zinc finger
MAISIIEAAEMAKARTNNKRWHAACDKAVAGASTWIITELHDCLAMTTESGQTYFVTESRCQCRAFELGQPCKHRCLVALRRLAETAPAPVAAPARRVPTITRSIQRRIESDYTGQRYPVTYCDGWAI